MSIIKEKYKDVIQVLKYEVYVDGQRKGSVDFSQVSGLWYCSLPSFLMGYSTMDKALNKLQEWVQQYCNVHSLEYPLKYWWGDIINGPVIVTTMICAGGQWHYRGWPLGSQEINV
jgi:hypothetical protein